MKKTLKRHTIEPYKRNNLISLSLGKQNCKLDKKKTSWDFDEST